MTTCVIPARGGSKRIPQKNLRNFCEKPMITWPISTAINSGLFDRIIVSTDDSEIAEVAQLAGAEIPFKRPKELADDHTSTRPVVAHAIEKLRLKGPVCCLYATAPFVLAEDLKRAFLELEYPMLTYVFPVVQYPSPIQRAFWMNSDNDIIMVQPEHFSSRSQDLEVAWHDAGQFYLADAQQWRQDRPIFGPGARGITIPQKRAHDIDTEEDWELAELLFQAQRLGI